MSAEAPEVYLHLEYTNISRLPGDIHKMKFLENTVVEGCPNLDHLPSHTASSSKNC
jgi:hypothetical protein